MISAVAFLLGVAIGHPVKFSTASNVQLILVVVSGSDPANQLIWCQAQFIWASKEWFDILGSFLPLTTATTLNIFIDIFLAFGPPETF